MSFVVQLGETKSENNMLSKSFTSKESLTGVLKEGTSIIAPTILVTTSLDTIVMCNYMYIAQFKRYYYITDIRSENNACVSVSGRVDVLKTYDAEIRKCRGITAKQENKWNLYINDGSLTTYQNPVVQTREFPNGFIGNSYVLAVAGSNQS